MRLGVVGSEHEIPYAVLCAGIVYCADQGEVAPVTVHDELASGKRDVITRAISPFPHREPHKLETRELSVDEVDFCVRQFARRLVLFVAENLDFNVHDVLQKVARLGSRAVVTVAMRLRVRGPRSANRCDSTASAAACSR